MSDIEKATIEILDSMALKIVMIEPGDLSIVGEADSGNRFGLNDQRLRRQAGLNRDPPVAIDRRHAAVSARSRHLRVQLDPRDSERAPVRAEAGVRVVPLRSGEPAR